ncbi:hypothetical protein B0O80DRAFT_284773 [Mortierella sp. GBAus27b]|nr:hypothetical protein B0O80DRAFT_284773 [Mortierella sp. GBAus27b]
MTLDLKTYSSLLHAAKADQDLGNLKSAFASYLKAHTIIVRILQEEVVFKDQDSIESAPDNFARLIAHAQEILRRIKDIVTQSRKSTDSLKGLIVASSSSTKQLKGTTSSSPSQSIRPGLASRPSQRSVSTNSQINKRTKKNVPLIPISPLTKQALQHSYSLSQATQKLEQAKQGSNSQENSSRELAYLRRLIEDVHIQKTRLDSVNTMIQSVASSTVTSWDPDLIARQLTIVDLQLFKEVAIPKDLVRADRNGTTRVQHCIDFEIYVAHGIAHLLLADWNSSRQSPPANNSVTTKGHPHAPINAVAHMIRVAYILLHVYRNLNSFMAVMRALTSPEITRMHKSWTGVSFKVKELYRRMVHIYRAQEGELDYKETLLQKLDAFQDVGKDAVVAIPWMRYHLDEVKSIVNSYLTGQNSADETGDVILSAPGARKLSAVSAMLTQCRTNEASGFDRQDMDDKFVQSRTHVKHREPVLVDGLKSPLTPILDLNSLGSGDIALHHWLLSRPFLNKQQLIDESLEIEPLSNGEELPCYEMPFDNIDYEDIGSVDDDPVQDGSSEYVIPFEHDLEPLPQPQVSRLNVRPSLAVTRERVSESDINSILSELLKDDDASDNKGLFDDLESEETGKDMNKAGLQHDGRELEDAPEHSRDVLQFLGMDPNEHSDSDNEGNQGDNLEHGLFTSNKGKGKASQTEDSDEINDLLARVKGLVQESKIHTADMKSNGYDLDEDDDEGYTPSNRRFEPFHQGSEEDQMNYVDHQSSELASEPRVDSILSIEALRRQLHSLDRDSSPANTPKALDRDATEEVEVEASKETKSTIIETESELRSTKEVPTRPNENTHKIETNQPSDGDNDISRHIDPLGPTVSIQELDRTPLDSSLLFSSTSMSTLHSESTTTATMTATMTATTTTGMTTHSRVTALASDDNQFNLEASALEGVVEPISPGFKIVVSGLSESTEAEDWFQQHTGVSNESGSDINTKKDVARTNESSESHKVEGDSTSAGGEAGAATENNVETSDKSPRAGRQRRRIAGGIITRPLLSKASTSSLSNVFIQEPGDEHAREHEPAHGSTPQQAQDVHVTEGETKSLSNVASRTVQVAHEPQDQDQRPAQEQEKDSTQQ